MAVIGSPLILAGVVWLLLVVFASGMASRGINTVEGIVMPGLLGAVPIILGVALIWFR